MHDFGHKLNIICCKNIQKTHIHMHFKSTKNMKNMKKFFLFLVLLLTTLSGRAQWTKPVPSAQALAEDAECYLYNVQADAFLCGANDWGTRASAVKRHGHKIWLKKKIKDGETWDGRSYYIWNFIEDGGMANQDGVMIFTDPTNYWVDRAADSDDAKNYGGFVFTALGDNVYTFAPSPSNTGYDTEWGTYAIGMKPSWEDNRLYLNMEDLSGYAPGEWWTKWIFVSPSDYQAYLANCERYDIAVKLGESIAEVETAMPEADIASVKTVYNNTSSTAAQLREAIKQLAALVASASMPVDITGAAITNSSYDLNNNEGWSGDVPGFQNYGNAERYWANLNTYQELPELPAGVYRVALKGFYRSGWNQNDADRYTAAQEQDGVSEYQKAKIYVGGAQWNGTKALPFQNSGATATAPEGSSDAQETTCGFVPNNMQTAAVYCAAGKYPYTSMMTAVKAGQKMTIGVKKTETYDGDWVIMDDWRLYSLGNSDIAYQMVAMEALTSVPDYEAKKSMDEEMFCQQSVFVTYCNVKHTLESATDGASIGAALEQFGPSVEALEASFKAYAEFYKVFNEARDWLDTKESLSEAMNLLVDYLDNDTDEGFNGNGSADYILQNGTLDADQLAAEQAYLEQLWNDAVANSMVDGDDCTALLRNPNFSEEGGWTASPGVTFPTDGHPVLQGWNMVFDVNQELTGLQNGLYELSYNGLYRPAGVNEFGFEHTEAAKAFAYINNYETRIPSILDNLSEEAVATDDANYMGQGYGPNSAAGAVAHFEAGKYQGRAYGLVTDGTMKIGFKNNLRVSDNSVAWVGRARLTFRAKNAEALREVIKNTQIIVDRLSEDYCGRPEQEAMEEALNTALDSEDEDLYDALIALKKSIEDVENCVAVYEKFAVALYHLQQAIANNTTADEETLAHAQQICETHYYAFLAQSYSAAEAEEAVAELNALVASFMFSEDVSEDNPVDYTSLIINNNFDPDRGDKNRGSIDGWTTTAMNGYKEYSVSYNRTGFELNQKLTGLPKGKFKVTVHTYYRAGYWDEEWNRIQNGEETHLTTLYAQTSEKTYETKVMNLTEGASDAVPEGVINYYTLSNGKYAPDGTTPTVAYFNAGYYLNELTFMVPEDGEVVIGLTKKETFANDYEVVGEWQLWYMGEPIPEGGKDVSSLIVNNNFDPDRGSKENQTIEGWTTSAMNGYKEYSVSYNRAGIDLYQDLSGLKEGTYKVTVHTYYRAGYYDEEWSRVQNGEETHLTTLYAQTTDQKYEKKVMNLCEGASDAIPDGVNSDKVYTLGNGKYAPDGTSPTVAYFKAGYYLNELMFYVGDDGKARIGLSKTEILPNDYEVVGEWNLYYFGKGNQIIDGIEEIDNGQLIMDNGQWTMGNAIFDLSGRRVKTPTKGVYIVNGKKVLY